MKRAIITGATGAIGTALIKKLIDEGVEILVFTRECSKRNQNLPVHPLVQICFCALEDIGEIQNDTGKKYDVFYHLAWSGASGTARDDMYKQNLNVKYALDAVGAAKSFGCSTFIGIGSQAEYGRLGSPLTPESPTFPEMGYGYAKLCAGHMTRDYALQLGLRHMWVRVLSIYGPNDGESSMVMSVINKLRQGIVPEVTKGEQIWDYLYSADAAAALYMLAEKGCGGKVYVLGSGKARRLREYIEEIRDIAAPEMKLKFGAIPYKKTQVMYLCADTTELKRDIGWAAKKSFGEGINEILNSITECGKGKDNRVYIDDSSITN